MNLHMSKAPLWGACPGYPLPVRFESSLAAEEGTAAAEVLENRIKQGLAYGQQEGKNASNGILITPEMEAAVERVFEFLSAYAITPGHGFVFLSEFELRAPSISEDPPCTGRADLIAYHPERRHLVVLDFKYGRSPVYAERNLQLAAETLGFLDSGTGGPGWDAIAFAIVQPRSLDFRNRSTWHALAPGELVSYRDGMRDALNLRSRGEDAYCTGKQCRYCPRLGTCPATQRMDWYAVSLVEGCVPVSELSGPEMSAHLEILDETVSFMRKRLDALRAEIEEAIVSGIQTGHTIETVEGASRFTLSDSLVRAVLQGVGLDPDQEVKVKTPTQVWNSTPAKLRPVARRVLDAITARKVTKNLVRKEDSVTLKAIKERVNKHDDVR